MSTSGTRWTCAVLGAAGLLVWWLCWGPAEAREGEVEVVPRRDPTEPARDLPQQPRARAELPAARELPAVSSESARPGLAGSDRGDLRTSLKVRFVDEDGAPVAGAELSLVGEDHPRAASGADGMAVLALERALFSRGPRRLTLEARRAGFARDRRTTTTQEKDILLSDWCLVPGGSIEGRVVDPDGRGIPGVEVGCLETERMETWERERRASLESLARPGARALTDPDGAFRLDEIPAGRIRLVSVAEDRPAAASELVDVPAGGLVLDVLIRMEEEDGGTTISGIVLSPDRRPVAYASLEFRCGGTRHGFSAGPDGRFEWRCDSKEPRDVVASDPEHRYREATGRGVIPGTRELQLVLQDALRIALTVRSQAQAPIERYAVALIARHEAKPLAFFPEDERPLGLCELAAPGQEFFVEVRANGWLPARLGPFPAEDPPGELACTLVPARGLRGTVTADHRPIAGARVRLHRAATKNDRHNGFPVRMQLRPENETESASSGAFELSVEGVGAYYLRVEAEEYAAAERGPLELSPDAERTEDVELDQGGTLIVNVHSQAGASVAGILVAISRGDGLARTERTDEQGALVLPRLTPGPWQVALSEREIVPESGPTQFGTRPAGAIPSNCCVLAGEVTRVDLWLEDREEEQGECRLTGRLTIDGKPAEGWVVALDQERATVRQGQAFVEPGLFRIGAGEPGSYRLRLSSGSQDPSTMLVLFDPVELVAGERYWSLELRTGALEGSMSAEDPAEALVFFRWQRGTAQAFVPLVPGADGRFRCARVPAGNGAIVRCDPTRPLEEQSPEVLRELGIEAGRTVSIEL